MGSESLETNGAVFSFLFSFRFVRVSDYLHILMRGFIKTLRPKSISIQCPFQLSGIGWANEALPKLNQMHTFLHSSCSSFVYRLNSDFFCEIKQHYSFILNLRCFSEKNCGSKITYGV